MLKDFPDHHDAELVLKLYELRRDPVMRESRDAINNPAFLPRSLDDLLAVTKADHPLNRSWRQVNTYWEMAYGLVKHGVLNADLMMESNGEGMLLYAKVQPWVGELREKVNPRAFINAEWVATQTEAGKRVFAIFEGRMQRLRNG